MLIKFVVESGVRVGLVFGCLLLVQCGFLLDSSTRYFLLSLCYCFEKDRCFIFFCFNGYFGLSNPAVIDIFSFFKI